MDSRGAERAGLGSGFRLAEWTVRPEDGSLSSPAGNRRLEPLLMDLLVFLCSRAGQVVPKKELLAAVWKGRFVSDDTVKGSLYQLRKALGDDPRRPRFLETIPKRGYRILVQPVPLEAEAGASGTASRELYERGRAALAAQPGAPSLRQARLYFERATQAGPERAEAWSGLARTYLLMALLGLAPGDEILPRARAAASRAVELSPELSEAHAALGMTRFFQDHDFAGAEAELRLAIELAPEDPLARRWHARFLSLRGRHAEAVAEARRALAADPLALPARRDLLEALFMARRYEETIAEALQLSDLHPHSPDVQLGLVWIYGLQGRDRQAFEAFAAGLSSLGAAPAVLERAREAFERGGLPALLRLWAELLEHEAALGQKTQNDLLALYALLGDNDRCFELLEGAAASGNPFVLSVPASPLFDGLRADPRYPAFAARLGH